MALTDGTGRRAAAGHGGDEEHGGDGEDAAPHVAITKPTWVQPHPRKNLAYVALNGAHQVVEVDLEKWRIVRRFPTGRAPYNLDVTPDGKRLVVTYKGAQAVGVIDLKRVRSSRGSPGAGSPRRRALGRQPPRLREREDKGRRVGGRHRPRSAQRCATSTSDSRRAASPSSADRGLPSR